MTAAINAKSDVLGERELDAVSGGDALSKRAEINQQENLQRIHEDQKAAQATKVFSQILNDL